jgi:hypothetical protein
MKNKFIIVGITISILVGFKGFSQNKSSTTSEKKTKVYPKHDEDDVDPEPTPKELLKERLDRYNEVDRKTLSITLADGSKLTLRYKYYCAFDGKIDLPKRYLKMYGLSTFKTHNFVSEIDYRRNGKILYKGLITRKDFDPLLFDSLKQYATLLFPSVELTSAGLMLHFSATIPLTDVGTSASMFIDPSGKKTISDK